MVPKLYILRGGTVQISSTLHGHANQGLSMAEAGGFSYFGENILEVSKLPQPGCQGNPISLPAPILTSVPKTFLPSQSMHP